MLRDGQGRIIAEEKLKKEVSFWRAAPCCGCAYIVLRDNSIAECACACLHEPLYWNAGLRPSAAHSFNFCKQTNGRRLEDHTASSVKLLLFAVDSREAEQVFHIYSSLFIKAGCTVVWWSAPFPHSRGSQVQLPAGAFLCACSPRVCVGSLLPLSKNMHVRLTGVSRLCLSPDDRWDRLQPPRDPTDGWRGYRKWMDGCLLKLKCGICVLRMRSYRLEQHFNHSSLTKNTARKRLLNKRRQTLMRARASRITVKCNLTVFLNDGTCSSELDVCLCWVQWVKMSRRHWLQNTDYIKKRVIKCLEIRLVWHYSCVTTNGLAFPPSSCMAIIHICHLKVESVCVQASNHDLCVVTRCKVVRRNQSFEFLDTK